jgi:hypothetical protein
MAHFNNKWESKLHRISESGSSSRSSFWKFVKRIKNRGLAPLPPLREGNIVAESDGDKATLFANVLAIQNVPAAHYTANDDAFPQLSLPLPVNYEPLNLVNVDEVQAIVEALPKRKAPGPDGITNGMLKKMPLIGMHYLYLLIKSSMLLGAFPIRWKTAIVVMLPKTLKPESASSKYRPISLLSAAGKVGEAVLLRRLKEVVDARKALPEFQFGFRQGHSTTQQLLRLTEWTTRAFNHKKATGAVFLDVEKAFDQVWHEGLLHKLRSLSVPHGLYNVLKSYLNGRVFSVRVGDTRSPLRSLTAGVPQGSLLSPLLFAIYMSDVPLPSDPHTRIALYADDTTVYSSSKSPALLCKHLQRYLDTLTVWCRDWKVTINAMKSKAILISKKRVPCWCP